MRNLFGFLFSSIVMISSAQCDVELGVPSNFELVEKTDSSMAFKNEENALFLFSRSPVPENYSFQQDADSIIAGVNRQNSFDVTGVQTKVLNEKEYLLIRMVVLGEQRNGWTDYYNMAYLHMCDAVYNLTFVTKDANHKLHDATFERILSKTDYVD